MVAVNRESFRVWREEGRAGIARRLAEIREAILADPLGAQLAQLADAPEADREWFARPRVQQVAAESLTDGLRDGVDGWVDDSVAFVPDVQPWGFDPAAVTCPTHFWHSDDEVNSPLSAVRRLAATIPGALLTVWHNQGHSAPSRHAEQVLTQMSAILDGPVP